MKVISIVNQKGGCAKTSTAVNISSVLAEIGYKTLLIDIDPQGNASSSLGIDIFNSPTIYNVLHDKVHINKVILETGIVNLFVVASNIVTARLEREMTKITDYEKILFNEFANNSKFKDSFDFVIIDCPPSLGALSTNSLVASDHCIIPVQPGTFALEGVSNLLDTINLIKEEYRRPELLGIILTFFDARTTLSNKILNDLKQTGLSFETVIRVSQSIPKAQEKKLPVNIFDDSSRGSKDYRNLTFEILEKLGVE